MTDTLPAVAQQQPKTILIKSNAQTFNITMPDIDLPYSLSKRKKSSDTSSSSTTSSLTYENLMRHNILHSCDMSSADISGELPSSPSSTSDSHPRELQTPINDAQGQTPFPSLQAQDSTSTDVIDTSPRPHHVHFRPRVRITSGISRHRQSYLKNTSSCDQGFAPAGFPPDDSSLSSSPSSSISAPLRSPSDDEADKPGWGPLGRRVSLLACDGRRGGSKKKRRRHSTDSIGIPQPQPQPCERTPLLRHTMYAPKHNIDGRPTAAELLEAEEREIFGSREHFSREIDVAFGPMPNRLLNPNWWRWRLEPIVCCLEEPDF